MKYQIASISLLAGILSVQVSIDAPTDAYKCESTVTMNGILAYTGSSLYVEPNAHLIASIVIIPATIGFGVDNYDNSNRKHTGSTFSYAGYSLTGDMQ